MYVYEIPDLSFNFSKLVRFDAKKQKVFFWGSIPEFTVLYVKKYKGKNI